LIKVDEVDIHPVEKRWNLYFFRVNEYQPHQPLSTSSTFRDSLLFFNPINKQKMRNLIYLFILFCPLNGITQNMLDIGIFNNPVNSNKLEVRIKTGQTVTNGVYSAGVFTIRFPVSYGVTLTAPASLNFPLYFYSLANQGTDGAYQYYSFSFVNPYTVNWSAGIAYPIAIIEIIPGSGSGTGTFEIVNNAWTQDNNGDVYQELNGQASAGSIYQSAATAPLGMSVPDVIPPTIACTEHKIVGTALNQCTYTHTGTSWDAVGNDNFPGFTITYTLSGATVNTLSGLSNSIFNKGLTTVAAIIRDGAGLSDTCSFTVTVNDVQAPSITAPPAVSAMANAALCTASNVALGTPVSSDNCAVVQVTNNAPAVFPKGNTIVTWTATDGAGLTATSTQTVTVQSNLAASSVNLSATLICTGAPINLSFTLAGGVGPYTVVYNINGNVTTANNYTNNQPIIVSPLFSTNYALVSVTDAMGCSITPAGLSRSVIVKPDPTLTSLVPSAPVVCLGMPITLTANGLIQNAATTFQYTLNGTPTTQTINANNAGTATLLTNTFPAGNYTIVVSSISMTGCTVTSDVNATFSVDAVSPACRLTISGALETIAGDGVGNVSVNISGGGNAIPAFSLTGVSNPSGTYTFADAILPASNCTITPYKNDNQLNGVSTFDLVLISKHILGLETLDSPYKIIAADANGSNLVTTADIVDLRKMILGFYDELPNNTSWRFVDAGYLFPDPANPFSDIFPEHIVLDAVLTDRLDADFVAVKTGDVNSTVIPSLSLPAEDRFAQTIFFDINSAYNGQKSGTYLEAGEIVDLHFKASMVASGFQFTLDLDALEIVDLRPGPGMHGENFAVFRDAVTCSYFNLAQAGASPAEFIIRVRAVSSGWLPEKLKISSRITPVEAFIETTHAAGSHFNRADMQLRFLEPSAGAPAFDFYQVRPNPFTGNTNISFYLPENEDVIISISDETGKVVFIHQEQFVSGHHTFMLDGSVLPAAGIFFCKIQTLHAATVRRMVKQ